jgi:hypothetical protein
MTICELVEAWRSPKHAECEVDENVGESIESKNSLFCDEERGSVRNERFENGMEKKSSPSVPQVTIDQIVHQCEATVQFQKCFKGKSSCKSVQGRQY